MKPIVSVCCLVFAANCHDLDPVDPNLRTSENDSSGTGGHIDSGGSLATGGARPGIPPTGGDRNDPDDERGGGGAAGTSEGGNAGSPPDPPPGAAGAAGARGECATHSDGEALCELECPGDLALVSDGFDRKTRSGYWMCGRFTASAADLSGADYLLRGHVSIAPVNGPALGSEDGRYRLETW